MLRHSETGDRDVAHPEDAPRHVRAPCSVADAVLGFWYPACVGTALGLATRRPVTIADVPLIVGRDAHGVPFTVRDRCPHRGMPLAHARFDGESLECAYHGWRFQAQSGACRDIPSLPRTATLPVERIALQRFPTTERDGHIWVYIPDPALGDRAPPPVPVLPVFGPRHRRTHFGADVACGFDEAVLSLLDPAHGPFVHQTWWWRRPGTMCDKEKRFEPIPDGFRAPAHAPSSNSAPYRVLRRLGMRAETTIEFRLPGTRLEWTICGSYWFSSRTVVTPLDSSRCRLEFCAAWNLFTGIPFVTTLFGIFGRRFLRQDRRALERLAGGLRRDPPAPPMLIGDADQLARWYLLLRRAYRDARRDGRPVDHPLRGPMTLRWRS